MSVLLPVWLLWMACTPRFPDDDLVTGLEVVTVVADPPTVTALELYEVTAWVADARERGAVVLIWPCTPVTLGDRVRCAEGVDINGRGLPVSYWTAHTTVVEHQATVKLVSPFLPFLAFAEEVPPNVYQEGLPMPLNVLACDPGVCSVFEWLRADPEPGSEAYARLGRTLADPELIARQAPIGQMSLAVKMVKVVDPAADRPENPTLDAVGRGGLPEMAAFEWVWRIERGGLVSANEAPTGDTGDYRYGYDPEPQPTVGQVASRVPDWSVRVGYTAGRILEQTFDGQELRILWQGDHDRAGVMVVGLADGLGGTAGGAVELPQRVTEDTE